MQRFLGVLAAVAALFVLGAGPAPAAAADPAAQQVDAFDQTLLQVMKDAKTLGPMGRYRKLAPAVERAFDIATMIKFAVGPSWSSIPAAQQQALETAFDRYTVAGYAHNFNGYSGERFVTDPNVMTRLPDKLVTTHIISPNGSTTTISYRMRESGGTWKIIDVYYNGAISQLTTRRADFAGTLAKGGAPALIAHLNQLSNDQLK